MADSLLFSFFFLFCNQGLWSRELDSIHDEFHLHEIDRHLTTGVGTMCFKLEDVKSNVLRLDETLHSNNFAKKKNLRGFRKIYIISRFFLS